LRLIFAGTHPAIRVRMITRRIVTLVATLTLFAFCQGCTLIGLGVGAATPRYEEPAQPEVVREGLVTSNPDASTDTAPPPRRRVGSYWATGMGIGIAVDVALTIAGFVAVAVALKNSCGILGCGFSNLGGFSD
jgi:hypothetical protein